MVRKMKPKRRKMIPSLRILANLLMASSWELTEDIMKLKPA
jgi:hypothetical protein